MTAVTKTAPYYDNGAVTIYHGDCRDILPTLTEPVDVLVTDPPYGIDYQSNWGHGHDRIAGDASGFDVPAVLVQACSLLRRRRHAYVFGPIDLAGTPLTAAVELIWDKQSNSMGDLSLPWTTSHEPITFAVYTPSRAERSDGRGRLAARLRQGSVISCQRVTSSAARHPTEKPVPLLRQLIESSSCLGELVLDPFMGVGSTLVAAQLEGRRAIGIEVDERYCEVAVSRVEANAQRAFDFGGAA